MSKGTKQKYKQYTINTLEDACVVLKTLIIPVIIDLEKFKQYSSEAEELLVKCKLGKDIPAELYDPIHDKILYQQRELLRFMADHQASSFSYIAVRKMLLNKKFLSKELDTKSKETLNELNDIRNWSFHNPQSMLVAELEVAHKSIPSQLKNMISIQPQLNPVVINKVKTYSKEFLESFIYHNKLREKQFEMILAEMKRDYQEMFDALPDRGLLITDQGLSFKVQYIENELWNVDTDKAGAKVSEVSMQIQKGKYNGS